MSYKQILGLYNVTELSAWYVICHRVQCGLHRQTLSDKLQEKKTTLLT